MMADMVAYLHDMVQTASAPCGPPSRGFVFGRAWMKSIAVLRNGVFIVAALAMHDRCSTAPRGVGATSERNER
jgi:hypothetical protein